MSLFEWGDSVECRYCGKEFEPKKRGRKNTGFCCKHCADNWRQHNVYDIKPKKYMKHCDRCGAEFQTNRKNQRFCSQSCASKTTRQFLSYARSCENCGKEFKATNPGEMYCSVDCAKAVERIRFQQKKKERWKITKEHHTQKIKVATVYEQAEGICAICGLPVPLNVDKNDMWSPTRDHQLPLSRGGNHSYGNCQLAHRICNSCKGTSDSDFHIDWDEKIKVEPGQWEDKLDYLYTMIEGETVQQEAV